mmetsp:Transcript_10550/g.33725  ORF Transcript_10550/g.33725 Transcript_10550/m.33725 type:complete len:435 (+) Transcript_10550:97-1401(+)
MSTSNGGGVPGQSELIWLSDEEARSRRRLGWAEEALARPREVAESSEACVCCGVAKCSKEDDIVYCEGCDGAFHQSCYYIPIIPEDDFYCRACSSEAPAVAEEVLSRLGGEEDDEALWRALTSSALDRSVDFFVAAAISDRVASPALSLRSLARACESPLATVDGEPCAYVTLARCGRKDKWCARLARHLEEHGYSLEASWLSAPDEDEALARLGRLDASRRARILRCALELAIDANADFRARLRADDRFDRLGADSLGRNYFVFQDDAGDFAVCRDDKFDRPPMLSALSRKHRATAKKQPRKPAAKKHKKTAASPTWETVACSPGQLAALVAHLAKSRDGRDLWLAFVLRDKVTPHLADAIERAKLDAKRRDRAKRRAKTAQHHLLWHDLGGILDPGPRKRHAVDYTFSDFDTQIAAATTPAASRLPNSRRSS